MSGDPIFDLAALTPVYQPALAQAPTSWLLFLKFTGGPYSAQDSDNLMNGPGNFAIDGQGYVWVNDNAVPQPPGQFAHGLGHVELLAVAPLIEHGLGVGHHRPGVGVDAAGVEGGLRQAAQALVLLAVGRHQAVADHPAQQLDVAVVLGEVGRLRHQHLADEIGVGDEVEGGAEKTEAAHGAVFVGQMADVARRVGD